jgi:hypothetical protein
MSAFVGDTKQMSLGNLEQAEQQLSGAVDEIATALSQGRSPNVAASGGELVAEVTANIAFGMGGSGASTAMNLAENLSGSRNQDPFANKASKSSFMSGKRSSNLNALGVQMSYGEKKDLMRHQLRDLARIASGRAPLSRSNDVLAGLRRSSISGRPAVAIKITREMAVNLGIVPLELISSLGAVRHAQQTPGETQIGKALDEGDSRAASMLAKSAETVQENVAEKRQIETPKAKKAKALKMPAPKPPTMLQPPAPTGANGNSGK